MKLLHNDETTPIFTTDDAWSLYVGNVDLLANAKHIKTYQDGRRTWQSLTPLFDGWLRLRVTAVPGSSRIRFWAWWVCGDTGIEVPRLNQFEIRLTSTPHLQPMVDFTICQASPLRDDPENEGFTIGGLLHGQGITLRSFHVDFGTSSWGGDDAKHEPNRYMPRSPNKTGGKWPYMGLTFPVGSIELTDMYAAGAYGGFFQHANTGELVAESDFPDLQAGSHIHEHSKDKGWINYTDPSNTWRDRMSIMRTNPDGQHACQISVLAQMAAHHDEDEGLKMLLEAWSHVYTRQFPKAPRGTSHANSGQERAQGRVMKSGVDAFDSLHGPNGHDEGIAVRFGRRVMERFANDKREFIERHHKNGIGFHEFAGTGHYSTNEIGIHYWGMWRLHNLVEKLGVEHQAEVHFWMAEARKWCFDSFRFYDIPGDRHWGYPYYETKDHVDVGGPVSAEHFGWLAAVHYQPQNPTEMQKHKAILALGAGMDPRFVA